MTYKCHYKSNQYIAITTRKYRLLNKTFLYSQLNSEFLNYSDQMEYILQELQL